MLLLAGRNIPSACAFAGRREFMSQEASVRVDLAREYRNRAGLALELAAWAITPDLRLAYERVAENWRMLAEQVERIFHETRRSDSAA